MKMDRFFNPRATPFQTCNRIEKENQMTTYNYAKVNSHKMFYREAEDKRAVTVVLLHGFPMSSHMYRNLNSAACKEPFM